MCTHIATGTIANPKADIIINVVPGSILWSSVIGKTYDQTVLPTTAANDSNEAIILKSAPKENGAFENLYV